jgi:hypothetical protein
MSVSGLVLSRRGGLRRGGRPDMPVPRATLAARPQCDVAARPRLQRARRRGRLA